MREILFRGKRLDNGKFVEGEYSHFPNGNFRINPHEYGQPWLGYPVDPETVGQYTGLKDKNGVKIFEGDIVKRRCFDSISVDIGFVCWNEAEFDIKAGDWIYGLSEADDFEEYEVIGNIYDNPKLLKGAETT